MPDPPPRIQAFVLASRGEIVVLGLLSPDQVRMVYRELAERHLAHTGSNTGEFVLIALVALLIGSAMLAMSGWRREPPDDDPTTRGSQDGAR